MEQVLAKLTSLTETLGRNSQDEPAAGKPIPYERFFQVNERAKAAEAGLAAMHEEIAGLGAAHQASLDTLKADTATTVGALQSRHAEDLTFARHGFDDGDIASIRTQWKAQPEEGRPETAGEYWESVVASARAHHADPENTEAPKIHRTLEVLLPKFEGVDEAPPARGNAAPPRGRKPKGDPGVPQRGAGRAAVLASIRKSRGQG